MAGTKKNDRGLVKKKTAQGKWVWWVRLRHEGKMRWFGSFPTKTEAREFYEDSKSKQRRGQFFPENFQRRGSALLADVIDSRMAENRNRTIYEDRRYTTFWKARLPGMKLYGVSPAVIEQVKEELLKKGLANQSVVHYLKFLRHVLNVAIRDGKLERNPFAQVKMPKVSLGKTRFLSPEEEGILMKELGPVYGLWARLAILTGMRKTELFSLRWSELDLEGGLATLPDTKAGEVQYVHLNREAVAILRGMDSWKRSVWVFPSKNPAQHLDTDNFYGRVYLPAVKRTKLEDVTWHTLRHTFASRLAMSGATEQDIASCLRHSSTALVRRYAHLSPTHLKGVMEKVSAFSQPVPNRPISNESVAKSEKMEGEKVGESA
ncbi:MAG: site-specific integrase [Nitrospinae bacterium]|nr:site-specific integrase [Nitrospinota bacterium]